MGAGEGLAPRLWRARVRKGAGRVVALRRTPVVAVVLAILLARQIDLITPDGPPWPSVLPAGTVVTSTRALCYVLRDGDRVVPATLRNDAAFEERVGVVSRVMTHVRGYGERATFEDVGGTLVVGWRTGCHAGGFKGENDIALAGAEFAEVEEMDEARAVGPVEPPPPEAGAWINSRHISCAVAFGLAGLLADSLVGVGAWCRAVVEWNRRSCERAAAKEKARRGLCHRCGYSLEGLPSRRCPECGTEW